MISWFTAWMSICCLVLVYHSTFMRTSVLLSPAASPEISHHTAWRTWLFIAYSDERWLYYQFSLSHLYIFSLKGWENVLFECRSERFTTPTSTCWWHLLLPWQHFNFNWNTNEAVQNVNTNHNCQICALIIMYANRGLACQLPNWSTTTYRACVPWDDLTICITYGDVNPFYLAWTWWVHTELLGCYIVSG